MNTDIEMPAPVEKKVSFRDVMNDPGFLVAKGRFSGETEEAKKAERSHVKKLASAVFMALTNHGYATIRAVGPFANYNAVKAYIIATGYCAPKGIDLCFTVSFDEGNLGPRRKEGHVDNVVATVYSIKGYKDWSGDK